MWRHLLNNNPLNYHFKFFNRVLHINFTFQHPSLHCAHLYRYVYYMCYLSRMHSLHSQQSEHVFTHTQRALYENSIVCFVCGFRCDGPTQTLAQPHHQSVCHSRILKICLFWQPYLTTCHQEKNEFIMFERRNGLNFRIEKICNIRSTRTPHASSILILTK